MKNRRLISFMTAALTGISVTALPVVCSGSVGITASAEEDLGEYIVKKYPTDVVGELMAIGFYENSDEAYFVRYAGYGRSFTVPDEVDGRTITELDANAFSNKSDLRSVILPDTIRVIGDCAFMNTPIESISLPDSLEYIEEHAFDNSGLTSVTIPSGVKTIKEKAFRNCKSLKSVTIEGNTILEEDAFANCPYLESVQITDGCKNADGVAAFRNDISLENVNGAPAYNLQSVSATVKRPVLNSNIYNVIKNVFSSSTNVKFVDNYCSDYCNYVVATETAGWMNDALKARQLHDWVIRHCEFEDYEDGEKFMDRDNHVASSVFLSSGMNTRGEGIGESVCVGYAKAYTMLLSAANIESYVIGGSPCIDKGGRAWNAVKIDDKYYQCDVLADDTDGSVGNYGTYYANFLKNDTDMMNLHNCRYGATKMYDDADDHILLRKYNDYIVPQLGQCGQSYKDANQDGILDYDYNLSGKWLQYDFLRDLYAYNFMNQYIYPGKSMDEMNDIMDETLYFWFYQQHTSFEGFIDGYYGITSGN